MSVERRNEAAGRVSPARNVELKARDPDRVRSLATCEGIGAEPQGVLLQRDTYFQAPHGRLKLREEEGVRPHLIAYERLDGVEARESRYRIIETEEPEELKAALRGTLGVKVVVAKERRLFLWEGVRIHLDQVDGLGDFIEFEAVADAGSDLSHEEAQVRTLRRAFEIDDADLVAGSYCDMAAD
ncbi:MAG TPA: class IV adenylate cyclase [Solirubrobacterales bacterium]|nr:class IV adenylate cyclase [Solirubrobacterales bacterium]